MHNHYIPYWKVVGGGRAHMIGKGEVRSESVFRHFHLTQIIGDGGFSLQNPRYNPHWKVVGGR